MQLIFGVCVTALDVFLVPWFLDRGFRYIEALVLTLLRLIGGCLAIELTLARPDLGQIGASLLPIRQIILDPEMLYIAIGILGATVMPHTLYLHSANRTDTQIRPHRPAANGRQFALLRSPLRNRPDGCVINASILILAVSFSRVGYTDVTEMQDAHRLLTPVLGYGIASVYSSRLLCWRPGRCQR